MPKVDMNNFPDYIRDKFSLIDSKFDTLTFLEKDLLLSWAVDTMKVECIDYLHSNKIYEMMDKKEREDLDLRLQSTVRAAQTALFNLHQNKEHKDTVITDDMIKVRYQIS